MLSCAVVLGCRCVKGSTLALDITSIAGLPAASMRLTEIQPQPQPPGAAQAPGAAHDAARAGSVGGAEGGEGVAVGEPQPVSAAAAAGAAQAQAQAQGAGDAAAGVAADASALKGQEQEQEAGLGQGAAGGTVPLLPVVCHQVRQQFGGACHVEMGRPCAVAPNVWLPRGEHVSASAVSAGSDGAPCWLSMQAGLVGPVLQAVLRLAATP